MPPVGGPSPEDASLPAHTRRHAQPDRPGRSLARSARAAALALLASLPLAGQDLQVRMGASFGPLRQPPRRPFASLELDQRINGSPFWLWATADVGGDGQYLGLGPGLVVDLGDRWQVAAGSGPGYYSSRSPAVDLGSELEFRSTFYISRRLARGRRLGLSVSHYSNGGLARHNPGAETVRIYWQVPVPW